MRFMEKFSEILERKLMPYADKFANQRHIQSIRDGIILTMPLLIIGSLFLVLGFLPIKGYPELMKTIFGELWRARLLYVVSATFDVMTLLIVIGIAYRLASKYKIDSLSSAAIAFTSFLIVTPMSIPAKIGDQVTKVAGINLQSVGSKGIFVAIIIAILSTEIVRYCIKKNWTIKMPDSVPEAVGKSFVALIPASVVIILSLVIRVGFEATSYGDIATFINRVLGAPLTHFSGSYLGVLFSVVLVSLFWTFGLHGASIVGAVMNPMWISMMDQNRVAFQNGLPLPNIVNNSFIVLSSQLGGSGLTLSLVILMTFFAKSKTLKEMGRISLIPGIFNINEPVIFAAPIVMNPIMMIPFILAPAAVTTFNYFGMKLGFFPLLTGITVPWTAPAPLYGYLVTGGMFSGIVLGVASIVISGIIYYPFFKAFDRKKLLEEKIVSES